MKFEVGDTGWIEISMRAKHKWVRAKVLKIDTSLPIPEYHVSFGESAGWCTNWKTWIPENGILSDDEYVGRLMVL